MSSLIMIKKPKCLKYICLYILLRVINQYFLLKYTGKSLNNQFFNALLTYIFGLLSIFIFLYQKKYKQFDNTLSQNENLQRDKYKYYIYFLLFCCSIAHYFGANISYYNWVYSSNMKKINDFFLSNLETMIYFFSYYINEKYILNMEIHIHHIIAIELNIVISIIIMIISIDFQILHFYSFVFIIIIASESMYLNSLSYIILKKLNYEFFENIFLMYFYRNICGIIISLIVIFFYSNIYIDCSKFLFVFFYYLVIFFRNILELLIIEKTRPSYLMILHILYYYIKDLAYFFEKSDKMTYKHSFFHFIFYIILYLLLIIGICIYLEIIILNFCDLNLFTNYKISERGEDEKTQAFNKINESSFSIIKDN